MEKYEINTTNSNLLLNYCDAVVGSLKYQIDLIKKIGVNNKLCFNFQLKSDEKKIIFCFT